MEELRRMSRESKHRDDTPGYWQLILFASGVLLVVGLALSWLAVLFQGMVT